MRVLITGHLGYIGPVMTRTLKAAGHHVTGLDVGYFRECGAAYTPWEAPDAEIVKDIRDIATDDFVGVDAVVHLAALSNDPLGEINPSLTDDINFEASVRAARCAKAAAVRRFVFASSCSVYGAADDSAVPLDETASTNPVSTYAISKVRTEEALHLLADDGFSPVTLRNATAFGVSARTRLDLVLNNLMAYAHATGSIVVKSDGTPWRPLVHIEDISMAVSVCIAAPREAIHDEIFNIGRQDANYQVSDIALTVKRVVPDAELVITGESGGDPRSYRVDFTKALTKLPGFAPRWTLDMGAQELDRWFRSGVLESDHFDSRRFVRLQQLRHLMEVGAVDEALRAKVPL